MRNKVSALTRYLFTYLQYGCVCLYDQLNLIWYNDTETERAFLQHAQ